MIPDPCGWFQLRLREEACKLLCQGPAGKDFRLCGHMLSLSVPFFLYNASHMALGPYKSWPQWHVAHKPRVCHLLAQSRAVQTGSDLLSTQNLLRELYCRTSGLAFSIYHPAQRAAGSSTLASCHSQQRACFPRGSARCCPKRLQ